MTAPELLTPSRIEHVPLSVFDDSTTGSRVLAAEVAHLIRTRAAENRRVVLGLATGSTPLSFYAELVRLHREEGLSFANVTTFNLDEYYGLPPNHPQSYHHFMRVNLFDHIDIPPENTHVPDGRVPMSEVDAQCEAYEAAIQAAGGIDFQILGIGRTGHIGFNEPGSSRRSRTRLVTLDPLTRRDAAGDFGGEERTPRYAVTMGVRTILEARRVALMAWGEHKAEIVRQALEGAVSGQIPASFLQEHDACRFYLDTSAAGLLTRYRAPWLVGPLEDQGLSWNEHMTRRAILWLSELKKKAILKLTDDDYNESGLQDLLRAHGSAYDANLAGFYQMQHTITGWPGGRDPSRTRPGDAPVRPLRSAAAGVFPKRIVVFSAHPDDCVISMGGTLCRLAEHGHEVQVVCQVSGANAVSDETLWRSLRFSEAAGIARPDAPWVSEFCDAYEEGRPTLADPRVVNCKGTIRRLEALAAARVCGIDAKQVRFLDLPFYLNGSGRRRQLGPGDVEAMRQVLEEVQPHLVFAAGDLGDPHGTHRLCLRALRNALGHCLSSTWAGQAELWLYRGAWAEWELDEIDMAVPLSPQEVLHRRRAIFRHETQKDQALFLGNDRREFWQRTEDRSRRLAERYNALGLAEYEAIEAFKRYAPEEFVRQSHL